MTALLDIRSRLLAVINAKNLTSFTPDQVTFSNVRVDPDKTDPRATIVDIAPVTPGVFYGSRPIYYNRVNLDDFLRAQPDFNVVYPNGDTTAVPYGLATVAGITLVSELLVVLNSLYNGNFTLEDFDDAPLPAVGAGTPVPLTLTAKTTSMQYIGQINIFLFDPSQLTPFTETIYDPYVDNLPGDPSAGGTSSGTTNAV